MWWLLIVVLWSENPDDKPKSIVPLAFSSEAEYLVSDLNSAHLDSVAAAGMKCEPVSNPITEKKA